MKPQFFILAGPNGAGKSTYGLEHVPPGTTFLMAIWCMLNYFKDILITIPKN